MPVSEIDPNAAPIVSEFQKELSDLINKYSRENMSDTPDFILAEFLERCMIAYSIAATKKDQWFNIDPWTASKRNSNQ